MPNSDWLKHTRQKLKQTFKIIQCLTKSVGQAAQVRL